MGIKGRCRADSRTKDLIKRILPQEIAIIDHVDLDELAGEALLKKRIKAVINVAPSLSGRYPAQGPGKLLAAGITIIDMVDQEIMDLVPEGSLIEIEGNAIFYLQKTFTGRKLGEMTLKRELAAAEKELNQELERFALNTLNYAFKEMTSVFSPLPLPPLQVSWKGRQVLLVVRGQDYQEDLLAIHAYINEAKPFLMGVDGGADALLEAGHKPDLVIGDMDSISDKALQCGAEIVVHAYPNGYAPGEKRVKHLGLPYHILPALGTSEDAALLLAFEGGAELIIALGTHSNLMDFLNKGRKGMASTFLVRLKVGSALIDAKGVNKLYQQRLKGAYLAKLIAASLLPFTVITIIHPHTYQILRLLWMRMRIILGF